MGGAQSTSNTYVAVDKEFKHSVHVKVDSEGMKLTEMEKDYEFIFGGSLGVSLSKGTTSEEKKKEGKEKEKSRSAGSNFGSKADINVYTDRRTKEHSKFCAKLIEIGFTKIKPGEFLEFNVPVQNTYTVYITIYANNHGDKYMHPLCVNLPKNINAHILVEKNGQVVQSSNTDLFKRQVYQGY